MDDKTRRLIFRLLLANNILIMISLILILFFIFNKSYIYIAIPKHHKKKQNIETV